MELPTVNIGEKIYHVMKERGLNAAWLAEQIPCDRSNIYNIFSRSDISTGLLRRISIALDYDFFDEYSKAFNQESRNWGG